MNPPPLLFLEAKKAIGRAVFPGFRPPLCPADEEVENSILLTPPRLSLSLPYQVLKPGFPVERKALPYY